ncbi:MAG: hypothetical protein GY952_11270 [Rhodobacteraceae bacterium]|nr:hypothetical protein [Paracoccaceae bacterium]
MQSQQMAGRSAQQPLATIQLTFLPITRHLLHLKMQAAACTRIGEPFEAIQSQLWIPAQTDLWKTARVTALTSFLVRRLRRYKTVFEGTGSTD